MALDQKELEEKWPLLKEQALKESTADELSKALRKRQHEDRRSDLLEILSSATEDLKNLQLTDVRQPTITLFGNVLEYMKKHMPDYVKSMKERGSL